MDIEKLKDPGTLGSLASIISKFTARTDVVFGKMLLGSASPILVAFVEIASAWLLLFFYIGMKPFFQKLRELEKMELLSITISAILSSVMGPLFFLHGLKLTSAINTSLLVNLNPLFLSIVAVFIFKEELTRKLLVGVSLMSLGTLYLSTKGFTEGMTLNNGDFLIILSALSFSSGTLIFKKYVHTPNISLLVAYRAMIGTFILGGALVLFYQNDLRAILQLTPILHLLLAYALIGVIATYVLHYYALENTTMTNNALFTLSSPIIGVVYASAFLGEKIEFMHVVAMIIMICGLLVTKFDMIQKALIITKMRFKHLHNN